MENIDEDIKIAEHLLEYLQLKIDDGVHKIQYNELLHDEKTIDCLNAIENLLSRLKTAEKELEKYKDVTYFEKLEDGNLYKIDKERADDLYKHGNGCWLYIQMWARKKVEENV